MKKLLISLASIVTVLILTAFCFVGCSNSSDSSGNKPSGNKKPQASKYNITSISEFYNGLARFQTSDGNYGYLDVNGKVVIEPIYQSAQIDFSENAAHVSLDGVHLLINRKGKTLCEFGSNVKGIGSFKNGYIWVATIKETLSKNIPVLTYYNEKGERAFSLEDVDYVKEFSTFNEYGYALVDVYTGSSGYINSNHQYSRMIDTKGNFVNFIPENTYIIKMTGNYIRTVNRIGDWDMHGHTGYIDFSNKQLLSTEISIYSLKKLTSPNRNGAYIYIRVYDNTYSLLNGNQVLMNLHNISAFKDVASFKAVECGTYNEKNYYTIYMHNANGVAFSSVIDENGNVLISPTKKFSLGYSYKETVNNVSSTRYTAYSFSAGLCKAKDSETGLFGFIDLQGNWVIQPQYNNVTDFSEYGNDAYAVVDNVTVINKKGKVVFTVSSSKS